MQAPWLKPSTPSNGPSVSNASAMVSSDCCVLGWKSAGSKRNHVAAEALSSLSDSSLGSGCGAVMNSKSASRFTSERIEPWQGLADAVDFAGDFRDKRGVINLPPGAVHAMRMDVTVVTAE